MKKIQFYQIRINGTATAWVFETVPETERVMSELRESGFENVDYLTIGID